MYTYMYRSLGGSTSGNRFVSSVCVPTCGLVTQGEVQRQHQICISPFLFGPRCFSLSPFGPGLFAFSLVMSKWVQVLSSEVQWESESNLIQVRAPASPFSWTLSVCTHTVVLRISATPGLYWSFTRGLQRKRLAYQKGAKKWSVVDIRCTRFQLALYVFCVSIAILGARRFEGRTKSSVCTHPKRVVPGQDWMMDRFCEQQVLLHIFSDVCSSRNRYQRPSGFN